jgi:hypothetical protein
MISAIVLVVDVANVPATASPRTIRPGIGKPTTIITWPITYSRQSAKPRPRRRSSTCQIVIAERRRTMVEKSRRQHWTCSIRFWWASTCLP